MVDVFIIHSGRDKERVDGYVSKVLEGAIPEGVGGDVPETDCHARILVLESGHNSPKNWKPDAERKIRMAQVVIVMIGADASNPGKEKTMGWEVQRAEKYNKQIMIYNPDNCEIPDYLKHKNRFTNMEELIAQPQTLSQIKKRIDDFDQGLYDIFSAGYAGLDDNGKKAHNNELLEQYKMFQKSSEDLVSRRQSVNSFYISVNSAVVALTGLVIGLIEMPFKAIVVFFMCISGAILDFSWINILDSYGTLNAAKMKVISLLENSLPVALYDAEWQIMSDKLNNKKYVSFTNSEKRIPRIFLVVYALIAVAMAVYLILYK
jgi:hypothetical protein